MGRTLILGLKRIGYLATTGALLTGVSGVAMAQESILPDAMQPDQTVISDEAGLSVLEQTAPPVNSAEVDPEGADPEGARPVVAQQEEKSQAPAKIMTWSAADAVLLLDAVNGLDQFALDPADYNPAALKKAIDSGDQNLLNTVASETFSSVINDLRDGRTPMKSRIEWFVVDKDDEAMPTEKLMALALRRRDVDAVFRLAQPKHADYWSLLDAYNRTPKTDTAKRQKLAVNLDRWRWLPRDLGNRYIFVNVPEYTTELIDDGQLVARHKVVVGATKTPTPQLVSEVRGAIFNPKWYLPQSIIAEGIGDTIRTNPEAAKAKGYTWTQNGNTLQVIQGQGPGNALGLVKLDMPNDHAIYLHDTPSKAAFNADARAFSHGCIRTDKALLFAGLLSVRYAGVSKDQLQTIIMSGETTPVKFKQPFPVYIMYFTASPDDAGNVRMYNDIYGRDKPVVTALK
jgi:L,D-transpeptidase YcbB